MSETNDVKTVGREMIIGMAAFGICVQIILLFIPDRLYHSIGLWVGVAIGIVSSIHMRISLEDAMDQGEEGATKYVRTRFVVRYLVTAAVLAIVLYFRLGSVLTILIGLFSLKLSAYLQPTIHKLLGKFNKSK